MYRNYCGFVKQFLQIIITVAQLHCSVYTREEMREMKMSIALGGSNQDTDNDDNQVCTAGRNHKLVILIGVRARGQAVGIVCAHNGPAVSLEGAEDTHCNMQGMQLVA